MEATASTTSAFMVILVGMMGSGKSTVGKRLAELMDVPFSDTDRMLEHLLGRQIPKWFKVYGEAAFRDHESNVLKSLEPGPGVLATGGGIVMRPQNWDEFRRLGRTVFLDVDTAVLKHRLTVTKRKRPLLEAPDWEARFDQIYAERHPIYCQADICFPVKDEPLADVADRLYETLTIS
ncbi:MAG: shikimate kinase [Fimbriimonadaceae bacterium]|nr:shikimate kinase [Fimbriimonadaceae bacterium]QYK58573.1 MAG: shikimate kinase [Fimbriimonadaceae bacterium]